MHVVGTAGHVDHGKSSLVRALTGTDPDRFIEERLRGMTLDLGFAHVRFDDGVEAGIVDVPGHERFLHNMLAGAAGMELLLLVVAANEGPRPQTAEHLAILNYLNVRRVIIVLTKADLVDTDELAFAEELVRESVRGSIAEGAVAIGVSTIDGRGLDDLRRAIHDALGQLPPRAPQAPAYLPVDRVFALPGHGTIVTGTLMQGSVGVGDRLVLQPGDRQVRVRSLQVFGERRDHVDGGARVAANIPALDHATIVRGDVLASPELAPQAAFDVTFSPVASALGMLKRRTPVRAYLGSAEILGTLVFDAIPESVGPVRATLRLKRSTVVFPGATFVVRRLSPKDLLGGGTVAAFGTSYVDEVETDGVEVLAVLHALRDAGLAGSLPAKIGAAANIREERVDEIVTDLAGAGRIRAIAKPRAYVDGDVADTLFAHVLEQLEAREATMPFALGATSLALSRALGTDEPLLIRILASYVDDGRLVYRAGYYATIAFSPTISNEQRAFFDGAVGLDRDQPYLPAVLETVVSNVKRSKIAGLPQAFDTLLGTGALVKVGDSVYRGSQIAEIRGKLEAALRKDRQITMADFRNLVGTSRKFAVPLLEWFDATGVTVRNGDVRFLRERR